MKLPISLEKDRTARIRSKLLSPFSTKHRNRMRAAHLPDQIKLAFGDTVLTPDRKFLFVKNAKAGCSSIAEVLFQYAGGKSIPANIHRENSLLWQDIAYWEEYLKAIDDPKTTTFTFVREPLSRFRSAFKDFVWHKQNRSADSHYKLLEKRGLDMARDLHWNVDVFIDYIADSMSADPDYTNRHWREQWRNIAFGQINYDFIGRLDKYETDLEFVFEKQGLGSVYREKLAGHHANVTKHDELKFSAEAIKKIESLYAKDYELLNL